ncbi:MAG: ketopantoate reductase family protein [Candidatus Rokuibacteriota bacterium]
MINRIGIVGAGAIGAIVGGLLTRAGLDVTLLEQWPEHVEAMRRHGLRLSSPSGEETLKVRALHLHEAQSIGEPFDAVFIVVKSYDTEWATWLGLRHLKSPDGVVVVFQNGINDQRVAAIAGRERTLGCVILIGAGLYEAGHALRTDEGRVGFKIGEHDGRDTPRARTLAELMSHVAPSRVTTNLWGERWSKLALNCMLNPLAGLSGMGTAQVRMDPGARRIAVHLGAEVIQVGRALGHEVEPTLGIAPQRLVDAARGHGLAEVEAVISRDAASRGGGRPSMLQDVLRGRRTEIDYLNGYVVERGRAAGVETPFNAAVVRLFHERGFRFTPDSENLEPLVRMLP